MKNMLARVERLERHNAANRPYPAVSLLEPCENGFRLVFNLVKPGGGVRQVIGEFSTEAAAEAEFQRLCEKYRTPGPEPVLIIWGQ